MPRKEVLVQLSDDLLAKLDELAGKSGTSRSAIVRDAVTRYVVTQENEDKDRRWREGYERIPDTGEFEEMADENLRTLLEEESW